MKLHVYNSNVTRQEKVSDEPEYVQCDVWTGAEWCGCSNV